MSFITLCAPRLNILSRMSSNRHMKNLLLSTLFILSTGMAFAEVTVTIDGQRYYCSEDGRPPHDDRQYRCVPHCSSRNTSGECRRYGEDFCGYDAACVKYCASRDSQGECRRYGDDICRSRP